MHSIGPLWFVALSAPQWQLWLGYAYGSPALSSEAFILAMAQDAIRLVLEDMTARGEEIPPAPAPHIREVTVTLAA